MILAQYLILLLVVTPFLSAQTGTLRGQVTDETGAVIPGATILLTGEDGRTQRTRADSGGSYVLKSVPPRDYTVQATAPHLVLAQPTKIVLKTRYSDAELAVASEFRFQVV